MNLIKIDPKEYGLESSIAKSVSAMFKPMLEKMEALEKEANVVLTKPIEEADARLAREIRLKFVKVRTGTAKIHKELKSEYLAKGRFVDGWKNAQLAASTKIEERLMDIEKYEENLEKERIAKLAEEREKQLQAYEVDTAFVDLGNMPEPVWDQYLAGAKTSHEAKLEAERKAEEERIRQEEERIATEKAERERQRKIEAENLRLKKEAEAAERKRIAEEKKRQKQAEKERKAYEARVRAEREEKERIQAELRAKQEEEARIEVERREKIEADLKKGDAAKAKDLISDLSKIKDKYNFKSKKYKAMYFHVCESINRVLESIS